MWLHQQAPSMLLVERISQRAIIGSHVVEVRTIPLIVTKGRLPNHEKREILQTHYEDLLSTSDHITKVRMSRKSLLNKKCHNLRDLACPSERPNQVPAL